MINQPLVVEPALEILDDVRLGREIVAEGKLKPLRDTLGLTRSAMAEMLHTSVFTYSSWESRPETTLWPSTASRIGRFYRAAEKELQLLRAEGLSLRGLVPLHVASSQLGIPQEILFQRYRDEKFEAVDLGILGLWVYKEDIRSLM